MKHMVEVDELERLINGSDSSRLKIIDCRFSLTDPGWGENEYKRGHIPGSLYAHLEKDLSGEVKEHGGRHPLPDDDAYEQLIRSFGIDKESIVVTYDQGGGSIRESIMVDVKVCEYTTSLCIKRWHRSLEKSKSFY